MKIMLTKLKQVPFLLLVAAIAIVSQARVHAAFWSTAETLDQAPDATFDLRAFAAIDPIDTHVHAFKSDPDFTAMILRLRLHVLDITVADTQGIYGDLSTELARAKSFVQGSEDHARLCVTFDPFRFQQ